LIFLRIDDLKLKTYEGLEIIPREILDQGSQTIAKFLLDLFRSPGFPLYRSKIMAVGYEKAGKTTLLNCLFPTKGYCIQYSKFFGFQSKYYLVLQGRYLMKFKDRESYYSSINSPNPIEETELVDREWKVVENPDREDQSLYGIVLVNLKDQPKHSIAFFVKSKEERDMWLKHLRKACMNEATHGIVIKTPEVNDHPIVAKEIGKKHQGARLDVSVWDFAGQHEFYNNHHYFLSTRSVFLVLYPLDGGEQNLKGLTFWIKSLSAHLDPSKCNQEFSIIVVGTFLDSAMVRASDKPKRANKVREICIQNGMDVGFQYHEVSCSTLENISDVEEAIFYSIFGHSYMGERVPESYLIVEKTLEELKLTNSGFPVIEIKKLVEHCRAKLTLEKDITKRALSLLSLWGRCIYFSDHPELSKIVVLDPAFLTKDVLASLFSPASSSFFVQGRLNHKYLPEIWKSLALTNPPEKFWTLAKILLTLMEKFEVCFELCDEQLRALPLEERVSIIPSYLPLRTGGERTNREKKVWPNDPPFDRPIEIERSILFNVLPVELVSRLMVKLHPLIQDGLIWKNQVILYEPLDDTQALVRVSVEDSSFCVALRGRSQDLCERLMNQIIIEVIFFFVDFRQK